MKDRLEKTNRKKKKAEINIGLHHFWIKRNEDASDFCTIEAMS